MKVVSEELVIVKRYDYELRNQVFDKEENELKLVHQYISNLKAMINEIYRELSIPYLDLFVSKYNWRYNHRVVYDNSQKIGSLIKAVFHTPVRSARMFKEFYSVLV